MSCAERLTRSPGVAAAASGIRGVAGSSLISEANDVGLAIAGEGFGRGGLAGALPLALALGLNSSINWLLVLITGLGGTGGRK
jgi:hypothetical protein